MLDQAIIEQILVKVFPEGTTVSWQDNTTTNRLFWVIPGKQGYPRWIIPNEPRYGLPTLRQWQPCTLLSQLKWHILLSAYQIGQLNKVNDIRAVYVSTHSQNWEKLGWKAEISPVPVIYVGTPSDVSRLVVHLLASDSSKTRMVTKLPLGHLSGPNILQEAANLRWLAQSKPGIAPKPIFLDEATQIASETPVSGKPSSRQFSIQHTQWLTDLYQPNTITTLAQESEQLLDQIMNSGLMPDSIQCEIQYLMRSLLCEQTPLPYVYCHGDFAPWNIKINTEKQIMPIDWELAIMKGLPLYDVAHFHFIQKILLYPTYNVLSMLQSNSSVNTYLKSLEIQSTLTPKLYLYYLCHKWLQRLLENQKASAQQYLEEARLIHRRLI